MKLPDLISALERNEYAEVLPKEWPEPVSAYDPVLLGDYLPGAAMEETYLGNWFKLEDYMRACATVTVLREAVRELRAALLATHEHFQLVDSDGDRAKCFNGSAQTIKEDYMVLQLCQKYGFGAVMDSVARQWYAKDPIGAFVIGSCAGLVRPLEAKVDAVLALTAPLVNAQEGE